MRRLSHRGPLRVQRVFHPERDGTAHVVVLHPPGGLVGGDHLDVRVELEPEGLALTTTPGATKIYRTNGWPARQDTEIVVGEGASAEHVPQETLLFDGAEARVATRVSLSARARFFGWEITCLGRPACGERFTRGSLTARFEVYREGAPSFIDRGRVDAGSDVARAPWGLAGEPAWGTLVATEGDPAEVRPMLEGERASATRVSDLLVVRAIDGDAARIRRMFSRVRHHVRALWGREPIDPAIWRT